MEAPLEFDPCATTYAELQAARLDWAQTTGVTDDPVAVLRHDAAAARLQAASLRYDAAVKEAKRDRRAEPAPAPSVGAGIHAVPDPEPDPLWKTVGGLLAWMLACIALEQIVFAPGWDRRVAIGYLVVVGVWAVIRFRMWRVGR